MTVLLLVALPAASATAASPWWQVLDGSRPTNLWVPSDNVQEIETETVNFGEEVMVGKIEVGGEVVACLGTDNAFGNLFCGSVTGFPSTATAAQLESVLESAYGTDALEVSGGPVGGDPFQVTFIGRGVVPIQITPVLGEAKVRTLSPGGSGRLILTLTNLGDAPVDGTETPVTIVDELPDGAIATDIEALAGRQGEAGPVDCEIKEPDLVSCSFESTLRPYEAIEIDVLVSLADDPPVAGGPGKITVSGGNAPSKSISQEIEVSPDEVPFGIERFSAQAEEEGGIPTTQAGKHPFQLTTTIQFNSGAYRPGVATGVPGISRLTGNVDQPALARSFRFPLPAGLVGNATAMPYCNMADFFEKQEEGSCPPETAVGVASVTIVEKLALGFVRMPAPVFNLPPKRGEPARFGFNVQGTPVVIDTAVDPDDDYRIVAYVSNATQLAKLLSSTVVFWGNPGDPRHDSSRGWSCIRPELSAEPCARPSGLSEEAFLRQPVSCQGPLAFQAEVEPWNVPLGSVVGRASFAAAALHGCNKVPFSPAIAASPTSKSAVSSSGLEFRLDMPNIGLADEDAIAEGQAKKVEVTLPQGMTINPSQAEGLGACSPAEYGRETASSPPGQGCPESSKVGTVQISTPLLEEEAKGSLYVAKPYDNPLNSLIALYMVAKIPERGILVKQAGKVALNPTTGQIVTTFDDLPQLPFDTFKLNFFEGGRAPLVTPPKCGTYEMVARFMPWHASNPDNPLPSEIITRSSSFVVDRGPNGAPCPSGTPPFNPGFTAGTTNNAAGSYSPFVARLTRNDGEQEFSRFSMKLPKGVIGKIAGIPFCSEAAIAAARARTGPNGGQEELDSPSCPAASQIGRTLVGAGVGPELSYAPGKIYLAGPYQGSKLSIVAISTAKVGPFDLGNVVIRQALRVDPETAEVSTDGLASEPIPHILQGIVVHARDIRVFVDRPEFVLNPTNCERMTADSTILGSGLDLGSLADDQAVSVSSPFQAADCASLGFKPKLSLQLLGGTKRTATPRLKAVLTARKGDANIGRAQVTLPPSAFLEQAHIRTICTRVQFRAGGGNGEQCPKAAIYGRARAISPLLDEPLSGPVFLRSSNNVLPDLVAALHSRKVDINLVGRIDSFNRRIRNTFETVPDAPVTKFVLEMQGGEKGLIVNSTNICRRKQRAVADFKGQNGRRHLFNPVVKAQCGKSKGGKGGKRK
ncbi:MAG TPA: hypothetical protein VLI94_01850 [Solirubrobacterales bacterium]|nr:hypothetical protein [Solirubrobacterales bacterium]